MKGITAAILFSLCSSITVVNAQNDTCLNTLTLGISFPPVSNSSERSFAKTHLDNLGATKIRFAEDWALREPSPGNFNWAPLDGRINWAYANNYEIFLTIQSNGPSWACSSVQNAQSCVFNDNNDFKIYIDSLLQRYSGKISRIQFGNEWQSNYWYAGNAKNFIDANNVLYNAVQIYSPATQVVLGGFTTISLRFLAGCNGAVSSFFDDAGILYDATYLSTNCPAPAIQNTKNRIDSVLQSAQYDMIDLHFYDDVEQWDEYYSNFIIGITKPIIVSEFGGPNMNYEPYSDIFQAQRVFKYIKKLDSLQIQEGYFFKLVEGTANTAHSSSGLIDDTTLIEKPAYYLFKTFIGCSTAVNAKEYGKEIRIYPNPSQGVVGIQADCLLSNAEVHIYNSVGQEVYKIQNVSGRKAEISKYGLTKGIYVITINNGNESFLSKLIVD